MHLYLIGYRGSGKTTVGKKLAELLKWPLVDTDSRIEESSGQSIAAIFSQDGESTFRDLEESALRDVSVGPQSVISLGGGAILRPANQQCIAQTGKCAWLTGCPKIHYARITADASSESSRPNLTDRSGYDEVAEVMRIREPVYQRLANLTINTDNLTPDEVTSKILPWVESWNKKTE